MRLRTWTMAVALVLAAVGSSGCVVTVHDGPDRGDARLQNQGWEKLGERLVNGKADRDRIGVGRVEGRFRRVMIVVEHSSIELYDMDIEFTDGSHYSPNLRHRFAENSRSHAIDLPGNARTIRDVTFKYGNLPGGGAATVELWGHP
ncbi:MAG: hypothetical protein HOW73_21345 [Polyangiaceae bacterium]|nr:hypothetical protein [Polyangiaceae bacterium]